MKVHTAGGSRFGNDTGRNERVGNSARRIILAEIARFQGGGDDGGNACGFEGFEVACGETVALFESRCPS
jgi:hypothetical protein